MDRCNCSRAYAVLYINPRPKENCTEAFVCVVMAGTQNDSRCSGAFNSSCCRLCQYNEGSGVCVATVAQSKRTTTLYNIYVFD